jgi:hypothetical protein
LEFIQIIYKNPYKFCLSAIWPISGMIRTEENKITRRKTYPSTILSTTNPTETGPGSNLGLHDERLANNCLSHSRAQVHEAQLNSTENSGPYHYENTSFENNLGNK